MRTVSSKLQLRYGHAHPAIVGAALPQATHPISSPSVSVLLSAGSRSPSIGHPAPIASRWAPPIAEIANMPWKLEEYHCNLGACACPAILSYRCVLMAFSISRDDHTRASTCGQCFSRDSWTRRCVSSTSLPVPAKRRCRLSYGVSLGPAMFLHVHAKP